MMASPSIFGRQENETWQILGHESLQPAGGQLDVSSILEASANAGVRRSGLLLQVEAAAMGNVSIEATSATFEDAIPSPSSNALNGPLDEVSVRDLVELSWINLTRDDTQQPHCDRDMLYGRDEVGSADDASRSHTMPPVSDTHRISRNQIAMPPVFDAEENLEEQSHNTGQEMPNGNQVDASAQVLVDEQRLGRDGLGCIDVQCGSKTDDTEMIYLSAQSECPDQMESSSGSDNASVQNAKSDSSVEPDGDDEHHADQRSDDKLAKILGRRTRFTEADFCKRDLRPHFQATPYVSWADNDESGDFDPQEEARQQRLQINRKRERCKRQRARRKEKEVAENKLVETADFEPSARSADFVESLETDSASPLSNPQIDSVRQQVDDARKCAIDRAPCSYSWDTGLGQRKMIETNFTHPILFNCDMHGVACLFCTDPLAQLSGFTKAAVEVFDWKDSRPLEEMECRADTFRRTTLCTKCTWDRMKVVDCERHDLQAIPGVDPRREDNDRAVDAFLDDTVTDVGAFCSLCFNLASRQCRQRVMDAEGDEGDEDEGSGSEICGLRLCDACDIKLQSIHDGDFGQMLASMESSKPQGLLPMWRADTEFLRCGLIERHSIWASWAM